MEFDIDSKNNLTTIAISFLLENQYNSGMKDILVFGIDLNAPFGDYLLAKKFDDGSIKMGVLSDVNLGDMKIKKGWHSFDEIKDYIRKYNADAATVSNSTPMVGGGTVLKLQNNSINVLMLAAGCLLLVSSVILLKKRMSR